MVLSSCEHGSGCLSQSVRVVEEKYKFEIVRNFHARGMTKPIYSLEKQQDPTL